MRKCLLLALLLLSFVPFGLRAQVSLFDLETDTVCVGQEVRIRPHAMNASSYYWGFCSGYLENFPEMNNLGSGFQFNSPSGMEVGKDGDNYYGFVVNRRSDGFGDLLRLSYGKSLSSIPTVTNFGLLDSAVCPSPNSLFLTKDSGKWYLFMCGGTNTANSTLSRIDFGNTLANVPNGVRMGNPGNLLNNPHGIFVAQQGPVYYGFVVNASGTPSRLVRLNFGNNISRTPTSTNVTITGGGFGASILDTPMDIAPIYEQGSWYFLIPNAGVLNGGGMSTFSSSISRLFFGNSLSNSPVGSFVTPMVPTTPLDKPSAISLVKDCGGFYAFVTNQGKDEVLRYTLPTLTATNVSPTIPYNPTNMFVQPSDITRVIRDRDSLYMFVLNESTNELARMTFPQCHHTNIQSSDLPQPPAFRYDSSGLYNIYLAINEGQANMAIDCKQVRVLQVPPITLTPDTLICQGDTLRLVVASQYALDYYFSPDYNLSAPAGINVYVYPRRTFTYNIQIPFPDGCLVDTNITVDVSRVLADAGPDRTIYDGASTIIGGPNTYKGPEYTFEWFPTQFMDNPFSLTPTVAPPTDLTYYLKVTNTNSCYSIDTVNVKINCADLNLPNAFAPENQRGAPTRFGLLNKQIVTLNYFRIFDRWGQEVFSTTDLTKQWDGTVGGEPAPFAVYVWEADGFCESGQRINKSGNVTLIR